MHCIGLTCRDELPASVEITTWRTSTEPMTSVIAVAYTVTGICEPKRGWRASEVCWIRDDLARDAWTGDSEKWREDKDGRRDDVVFEAFVASLKTEAKLSVTKDNTASLSLRMSSSLLTFRARLLRRVAACDCRRWGDSAWPGRSLR
jgi:hypothetical protein